MRKKSKKDVEDVVVKFYQELEKKGESFALVYGEWRRYQDELVGDNTVSKYDSDKIRYFVGKSFFESNIKSITEDDVRVFIKTTVENQMLCKSACKALFHYIDNTLTFARRHKYISTNPIEFLHAKDFYCYCVDKTHADEDRVISDENLEMLYMRLAEDHVKNPYYIPSYAVELASLTGMRVGEIAGLRWDCVFEDYILVDKSQKYNNKTREYYMSSTKNDKVRKFPMTEDIRNLLKVVKEVEEEKGFLTDYVFSDKDGQINYRKISSCMKNKCRQLGIENVGGIHGYRRTVNSKMADANVPVTIRAKLLGHTKEVNERYYTYDVSTMDAKTSVVTDVNNKMHHFH